MRGFRHNREIEIDTENIHNALEDIIWNATMYNIKAYELCVEDKHSEASVYADLRDVNLSNYEKITGIFVDYGDLQRENINSNTLK